MLAFFVLFFFFLGCQGPETISPSLRMRSRSRSLRFVEFSRYTLIATLLCLQRPRHTCPTCAKKLLIIDGHKQKQGACSECHLPCLPVAIKSNLSTSSTEISVTPPAAPTARNDRIAARTAFLLLRLRPSERENGVLSESVDDEDIINFYRMKYCVYSTRCARCTFRVRFPQIGPLTIAIDFKPQKKEKKENKMDNRSISIANVLQFFCLVIHAISFR